MEMNGEYRIAASREKVWTALNDPEVLRAAIPGCEAVDKVSDSEFTATVLAKVGPVKAKFTGRVTLSDLDPPSSYTIAGEGQGSAGFARGEARVSLADDGDGTVLSYGVSASVGGKLAQIGSRLVDAAARKMADDFFSAFTEVVAPPFEEVAVAPEVAAPAAPGLSPKVWIVALVVLVIAILLLYGFGG